MMRIGRTRSRAPARKFFHRADHWKRPSTGWQFLTATAYETPMIAKAIAIPGKIPAMKSSTMDCSAMIPATIIEILGGITGDNVDEAAVTAAAYAGVYRRSFIAGISHVPILAASLNAAPRHRQTGG